MSIFVCHKCMGILSQDGIGYGCGCISRGTMPISVPSQEQLTSLQEQAIYEWYRLFVGQRRDYDNIVSSLSSFFPSKTWNESVAIAKTYVANHYVPAHQSCYMEYHPWIAIGRFAGVYTIG